MFPNMHWTAMNFHPCSIEHEKYYLDTFFFFFFFFFFTEYMTHLPITRMRNRYQAINTDFSELFFLKRIYVKYKNAILSLIDCFFHKWRIRHMGKYFPRYLIITAKHAVKMEPIEYLGKYMPICLILPCAEKQSIYDKIAFLYFT